MRSLGWPGLVLAAMVALYVAVFGVLTWQQHANFGTFGYDMGLHDQGIWLTSRFERPFVTIRGMHYFGHHVNLVSLLYVPFYWVGAGPTFLYLSETMVLAAGAVPLWLLARERFGDPRWALVPAGAFLLYPSLEWINWWHWHPEALAITPLLFAWWFARRGRWPAFAIAVGLALSTKEDVALAVTMLGLVIAAVLGRRRAGLLTAAAGLAWFLVSTRLIIPPLLGGAPFYERQLFPAFGTSLGSVLGHILTRPGDVIDLATEPGRLTYYWKLLGPLAFLPLLGAPLLLVAGPQLGVNVLSALPGTHDIRFQYSSVVIAAAFLATVEGVAWAGRLRHGAVARGALLGVLAVASVAGHLAWSPSPLGRDYDTGIWARRSARVPALERAVTLVPDGAGVSASYTIVSHLTHRRYVYEWPNPWILGNWGVANENPPAPETVDYLVLDLSFDQEPALLARLTAPGGGFRVVFERDAVLVARRVPGRELSARRDR